MSGTVENAVEDRVGRRSPAITGPLLSGAGLALVAGYVIAVDPDDGPGFLPCAFRETTGLWCPGCGLTRATHHLFHGHLAEALRFNLFVVPVLLAIVVWWTSWALEAAGHRESVLRLPRGALRAVVAMALAFAVVRNLPVVEGLRG